MLSKKTFVCGMILCGAFVGVSISPATIDCTQNLALRVKCNEAQDDTQPILDCIQAGKTAGRKSGVGSVDNQPMYVDYLKLTALCQTKYPNIGFLPLAQFAVPATVNVDPKLNFSYYYGIVYNKTDPEAISKAVALLSAYSSGEIKDQKALVFIQNALMGFACNQLTNNAPTKNIVQNWIQKNDPGLKKIVDDHCK